MDDLYALERATREIAKELEALNAKINGAIERANAKEQDVREKQSRKMHQRARSSARRDTGGYQVRRTGTGKHLVNVGAGMHTAEETLNLIVTAVTRALIDFENEMKREKQVV